MHYTMYYMLRRIKMRQDWGVFVEISTNDSFVDQKNCAYPIRDRDCIIGSNLAARDA